MGRKLFNIFGLLLMMLVLISMIAYCVHRNGHHIDNFFGQTDQEQVLDVEEIPLSVEDILVYRIEAKESLRVDSIFLTMPDAALVHILENFGTDLSNHEIVYIYENNRSVYDNVEMGAKIQQYLDSIQNIYH